MDKILHFKHSHSFQGFCFRENHGSIALCSKARQNKLIVLPLRRFGQEFGFQVRVDMGDNAGIQGKIRAVVMDKAWSVIGKLSGSGEPPPVRLLSGAAPNEVDAFWDTFSGDLKSRGKRFKAAIQSRRDLEKRLQNYILLRELMHLYGTHENETVVDYGCGPGGDLVGFALYSRAAHIIGMDISAQNIALAAHRLSLHKVDPARIEIIQLSDTRTEIPLPGASVDHIHCLGVLQHTGQPLAILREFRRILKPGATASLMVYYRNSIWFHLYVAYERMIVNGEFQGMDVVEAFSKTTDGPDCPIARCWRSGEFIELCAGAEFKAEFRGGYLTHTEMNSLNQYGKAALADDRLAPEHKNFMESLTTDAKGYPMFEGKPAGVGGVYILS